MGSTMTPSLICRLKKTLGLLSLLQLLIEYGLAGDVRVFTFVDESTTWNRAQRICEENGGQLASIRTQQDFDAIEQLKPNFNPDKYWIGLHRTNSRFIWADCSSSTNVSFFQWGSEQPDSGDCVYVENHEQKLYTTDCDCKKPKFICEKTTDCYLHSIDPSGSVLSVGWEDVDHRNCYHNYCTFGLHGHHNITNGDPGSVFKTDRNVSLSGCEARCNNYSTYPFCKYIVHTLTGDCFLHSGDPSGLTIGPGVGTIYRRHCYSRMTETLNLASPETYDDDKKPYTGSCQSLAPSSQETTVVTDSRTTSIPTTTSSPKTTNSSATTFWPAARTTMTLSATTSPTTTSTQRTTSPSTTTTASTTAASSQRNSLATTAIFPLGTTPKRTSTSMTTSLTSSPATTTSTTQTTPATMIAVASDTATSLYENTTFQAATIEATSTSMTTSLTSSPATTSLATQRTPATMIAVASDTATSLYENTPFQATTIEATSISWSSGTGGQTSTTTQSTDGPPASPTGTVFEQTSVSLLDVTSGTLSADSHLASTLNPSSPTAVTAKSGARNTSETRACRCVNRVLSTEEKRLFMKEILTGLSINKMKTSAYVRTLTSAPDSRVSARVLGCSGLVIIILFIGGVVLLDLGTLCKDIKMLRDRIREPFFPK